MPNRQAGWFGRNVLERILPGTQINPQTGGYQNVGRGVLGALGRVGVGLVAGPAGGAIAGRLANNWIDRGSPLQFRADPTAQMPGVQREAIDIPGITVRPGPMSGVTAPNMGFPGSPNPNLNAVNSLNAGNQYTQGLANNDGSSWKPQTDNPFAPGYQAPGYQRRDPRSGSSAGSGVLAEGADAQNIVGDMQIGNWLSGGAGQSRSAMNRMFQGHRS